MVTAMTDPFEAVGVGVGVGVTVGTGTVPPSVRVVAVTAAGAAPFTQTPVSVKAVPALALAQLGGVTITCLPDRTKVPFHDVEIVPPVDRSNSILSMIIRLVVPF